MDTYLVVGAEYGEVSNDENNLMEKVLAADKMTTIPNQVSRYVTELKGDAFCSKSALVMEFRKEFSYLSIHLYLIFYPSNMFL